ncbi:cupredoxin domain-containing protein [Candidatus Nitrosopumilus sediminis]|uniref:Uncharacterized protein n=1 Tax=Candidatus Nitrosopumilus sediminis TaxID=1229909 RepID=K0BC55_9ARCH|nr:hypothetical protein [Candidatus Nitrosopumilus sediminis]AFS82605.1 hypothetical protein NSED_03995 [Candidatus Nitrosopumilus sediminis]
MIILSLFSVNYAFASCGQPYDSAFHWLNVPCHDTGQTDEEEKVDWAEFYYFKGSEWMKYKTDEFEALMKDGFSEKLLQNWIGQDYNFVPENWYFWNYYELFGNDTPQTSQKPVEIPVLEKRTCDESCKDRIVESVNPYVCTKKPYSQNYECAHQSAMQPTILLTSTDETGKEMIFRPTEATVSLGVNNTIRWHNTSYKTTISNQEGVYESFIVPFNDIRYQVLDKTGNYTFYDESHPDVKIRIDVTPLDKKFNLGKPITKHSYFSDARFQIFRSGSDAQNFIHNVTINDSDSIHITLDNSMDLQYAVYDEPETTADTVMTIGDKITSGCTYHHGVYSRIFSHTLENINTYDNTAEFKETVDYVQGEKCQRLYSDPVQLIETRQKNMKLDPISPLKQFQSGISFDEIQCRETLVLVQKNDGSPACVTPETKIKLVERGWIKNECARLVDSNMVKYSNHVKEQKEKDVVWTPPTPQEFLLKSEYFEEWRNNGCYDTIKDWRHLSENFDLFNPPVLNELENEN